MKKRIIAFILIIVLSFGVLSACSKNSNANTDLKPELSQIQAICNLATLECYYHTVGKIVKDKTVDQELLDFLKKNRTAWIEYTGIARIGIDMTKVKIKVNGTFVEITLPEPELLSMAVDPTSYNEDSFYLSEDDWLVKNTITADLQAKAVDNGQEEMKNSVLNNTALMKNAQVRAQKLIKNYIDEIGKAAGIKYEITWVYEDGSTSTQIPDEKDAKTPTK